MIKRIKWHYPIPEIEPYVFDTKLWDIPRTMEAFIRALPDNCVAISVSHLIQKDALGIVERAARRKGIRIFWSKNF